MTAADALIAAGADLDEALRAYLAATPANRSARRRALEDAHSAFALALDHAREPGRQADPADLLLRLARQVEQASIYGLDDDQRSRVPLSWPCLLGGAAARWVYEGFPAAGLDRLRPLFWRVQGRAWVDADGRADDRPARLIDLIKTVARARGLDADDPASSPAEKEGSR